MVATTAAGASYCWWSLIVRTCSGGDGGAASPRVPPNTPAAPAHGEGQRYVSSQGVQADHAHADGHKAWGWGGGKARAVQTGSRTCRCGHKVWDGAARMGRRGAHLTAAGWRLERAYMYSLTPIHVCGTERSKFSPQAAGQLLLAVRIGTATAASTTLMLRFRASRGPEVTE